MNTELDRQLNEWGREFEEYLSSPEAVPHLLTGLKVLFAVLGAVVAIRLLDSLFPGFWGGFGKLLRQSLLVAIIAVTVVFVLVVTAHILELGNPFR